MPATIQGNKIRLTSDFLYRFKDQITEAAQNYIKSHYKDFVTLYWIPDLELYGLKPEYEKGCELKYEIVIGRYEDYGKYLPAALLRLDRERLLDREAFLLRFKDICSGAGLFMSDKDLLLATEELREGRFPSSIMFPGPIETEDAILGASWKVLRDACGLVYTDENQIVWQIDTDWNDDLILVNQTAKEEERQNTVEVCKTCLGPRATIPYFVYNDTIEFFSGKCEICGNETKVTYGVKK